MKNPSHETKETVFSKRCTLLRFPIETLMEGMEPLKTEENEFEYQEDSILKAHFGNLFGLSEIRIKAGNKLFYNANPIQK